MWIRSQDKEILGSFKVFYIDENMSDEIVIIGCDGHVHVNDKVMSLFELGTYKSKERAIEVLDEIEAFIENNYISIDEMPSHNNSPYPNYCPIHFTTMTRKKVFKMPEEE